MIRKPTEQDFREGTAVRVVRETRKIAVEGGKGVGAGIRRVYLTYLAVIMGFGVLASLLPILGGSPWMWGLGLVALVAIRRNAKARRAARGDRPAAAASGPAGPGSAGRAWAAGLVQDGHYAFDIAALARQAVSFAVPAWLLFGLAQMGSSLRVPLTVVAIALLIVAVLLVVRIFGDRTAVRFDAEAITVRGLLGESRMLWADAQDVYAHTFSVFDLKTLLSIGSRRAVVVEAGRNRLGGPARLRIPIALLELDREQQVALVSRLILCRAAGGAVVSPRPPARTATEAPPEPARVSPAGDPRASFDADAIRARAAAEREAIVAAGRPDLQPAPPARKVFGRRAS